MAISLLLFGLQICQTFGKLTLAHLVEEEMGKTSVSDGDNVRHGPSSNLTFSNDVFSY